MGFFIRNSAYILGYSIAISGSFLSAGRELDLNYILLTLLDVTIVLVFLFVSLKINNKLILKTLDNDELIESGNLSIPIIEAGTILATSIIMFSSMYGDGKYTDGLIFFILGQICLLGMVLVYEKITTFDDFELIKNNNISVALVIFSMVVGFSLIVASGIFGESSPDGLLDDILAFVYMFIFAVIFLIIFLNNFLDRLFFPKVKIEDEIAKDNISVTLPYAVLKLSIIVVIASLI
jgi:uncharacterized membrane protein YjfL (UPF0719 family)